MPLEINSENLLKGIDKLTAGIDRLEQRMASTANQVNAFDRLFGNTKNFEDFIANVKKLGGDSSADNFKSIADGISGIANGISRLKDIDESSLTVFSKIPEAFNAIKDLSRNVDLVHAINAIASITRAIVKLQKEADLSLAEQNVVQIGRIVGKLVEEFQKAEGLKTVTAAGISTSLNAISALINGLARIGETDLDKISIPDGLILQLQELLKVVQGIPASDGAEKKASTFKQIFQSIVTSLTAPAQAAGAQTAQETAAALGTVGRALQTLSRVSIDSKQVGNIVKTFGKLSIAFQGIGLLLKALPGSSELAEFSKTIQRLGIGLSGISRATANLDLNAIKKMVLSLGILGGATKVLSILLNFGKDKSVEAFAKVITAIASALNALANINRVELTKNKNLDQVISPIVKIIGSLNKLKDFNARGLGETVQGIAEILKTAALPDLNERNLDRVPGVVDKIVKSLERLKGVGVNNPNYARSITPSITGSISAVSNEILQSVIQVKIIEAVQRGITELVTSIVNFEARTLKAFQDTGRAAEQFGRTLIQQATQIQNSFSLQGLAQSGAFNIATQFEQTSSLLEAAGLNEDQLQLAQDFADTIGIQYPLSANQALDAILSLTRAGRSLEEIQFILPNASDLAALAGGDLDAVTNTLIGVAGAFQDFNDEVSGGFENIDTAANLLAAAADVGTASVTSLSEGLANVGPTAASAGLSLEETLAILSQFEDANIRGAEAGTQLRSVLNSLSSNRARDELRRLGVSLYDAQGNIRSLDDVIKDINDAYDRLGLSEAERSLSINQLGDSYARQGLNVLLLNDGYEETIDLMGQSDSAAEKAAQSMNNLAGDTEQFRGSMETLIKDVLFPLIGRAFRPLVQFGTAVVNSLLSLPEPIKDIATSVIQLVATFGSLLAIGLTITGALAVVGGGFLNLVSSAGLLILRLPLLIAQFAAVGASLLVALPLIAAVGAAVLGLGTVVSGFYRSVEQNIGNAGTAFDGFRELVTEVWGEITRIFNTVTSVFSRMFGSIFGDQAAQQGSAVANLFIRLSNILRDVLNVLHNIQETDIQSFFENLSPFIRGFINTFQQLGSGVFDLITGNFDRGLAQIRTGISNLLSLATDTVQRITGLHLGNVVAAFNEGDIRGGLQALFDSAVAIVRNLIRENAPAIRQAFDFLLHLINPLNGVETLLRVLGLDNVASVIGGISDTITGILGDAFSIGLRLISGERIQDIFGGNLGDALGNLFASLQRFVSPIVALFSRFFGIFSQGAQNFFGENFAIQVDSVSEAINGLAGFLEEAGAQLSRTLQPITDNLPVILNNARRFAESFLAAFQPLVPFIERTFGTLINVFSSIVNYLSGAGDISEVGRRAVAAFIDIFNDLPQAIGQVLSNLGELLHSSLLTELGQAFRRGDIVGGILRAVLSIASDLFRAIPQLFNGLGNALGLQFLTEIGNALSQGNIIGAIVIALQNASRIIQGFFSEIANFISGATDEIANRAGPVVGFFVRIVGGVLAEGIRIIGIFKTQAIDTIAGLLSIIQAATTPVGALTTAIVAAGLAVNFFGTQIRTFLVTNFYNLQDAVFKFIESAGGIGGAIQSIISKAVQIAGVIALISAVSAAIQNIGAVLRGEQNVFQGFLNFLVDAGANFLRFTGLSDVFTNIVGFIGRLFGVQLPATFDELIDGVKTTANQIGTILQYGFEQLVNTVRGIVSSIFDSLIISAQDAFHRLEQLAGTGNAATAQFFAVGDVLSGNATASAQEFFTTLGDALAHPEDLGTLQAQLRQGSGRIIDEFSQLLASGTSIADLSAQGLLDEVAGTLSTAGQIPAALQALGGNLRDSFQLFYALNPQDQAANFNAFFAAIKSGVEGDENALGNFLVLLEQMVESGQITQEQADAYRNQLVPATDAAASVLAEYNAEVQQAANEAQSAVDAANAYAYTLDGLAESFSDTSLAADELGTRFRDVISGLTADEIDLGQLFDLFSQLSPEEAAASFSTFFEAAIRGGVARAGNEEYFQQLQDMINGLRNSAAITSADRRSFLDRLATEAQTASTALDNTIGRVETLKEKLRRAKTEGAAAVFGLGGANNPAKSPGGGAGAPPTTTPAFDPNASGVDEYITGAEDKINERIADFAHEEAKRIKDDLKEEAQKAKELEDLKNGKDKEEIKRLDEFNIETQRREQDHQRKLEEIRRDAAETLEDAVANRDAAAARAAIKERDKKLRDDQETYDIETQRRIEDEQRRRAEYEVERAEKIRQAEQDLADLIAKHTEERLEREQEFKYELAKMREENAQKIAEQKAAAAATAAINQATAQDAVKTANTISLAMSQAFANIRNQLAQNAKGGGKGGGGKGGKDAINNPFGWTYDGLEVSGGGGKGKGKGGGTGGFISDAVNNFLGGASGGGGGGGGFINEGVNNFLDAAKKKMPKFETGGYVERTGYAQVDRGELVLNRGAAQQYMAAGGMGGVQINLGGVQVTAAPGMDVNALADAVEQRVVNGVASAFERMNRRKPL